MSLWNRLLANSNDREFRSLMSLYAFISTPNDKRNISTEQSLESISENLVQIKIIDGNGLFSGSGLMITTDGYITTAYHVVKNKNKRKIRIITQDNKEYGIEASTIFNKNTDTAIIKAKIPDVLPNPIKAKINYNELKVGDEARVLGFRDNQKWQTLGMVTETKKNHSVGTMKLQDLFLTDARGLQGQSGGIITNGEGEISGITIYSSFFEKEKIGKMGGVPFTHARRYINQYLTLKGGSTFF